MTSTEARSRFMRLQAERIDAIEFGVDETSSYMTHLSAAIEEAKTEYVASAVAEIAAIRADLDEPAHLDLIVFSN
jgi:hypothetical protein